MAGGTDPTTGKRQWVYAAKVKGKFQRIHRISGVLLNLLLFLTPWIPIGGHPAVQLDLAQRRLFLLGSVFTPRDTIFLVLMLLGAAFTLFFVTALFGRLWCGYACPQTVFLEEFIRPIETFWEGDRGKRMAGDKKPWTARKVLRKLGKHTSFAVVAAVIAMTFVSYFSGPVPLWTGAASVGAYSMVAAVGAALFVDFAWFREQFCNYLCPYARFQGALTDDHSVVIEYDAPRGEPRMKGKSRKVALQLNNDVGACIDCNKCVAVCPQGIDIRDGFQLECINCARCVDACTIVMDKKGQDSLVRYTTIADSTGEGSRWLRPRTVGYTALLTGLATAFLFLAANRHSLEATVNRAPGTLFQVDDDGWTRNTYLLNISNNAADNADTVAVSLDGIDGAELIVPPIQVDSAHAVNVPLVVRVPPGASVSRTTPVRITVRTEADEVTVDTTFKSGEALKLEG